MLRTSSSTESSTSAAQIVAEYDGLMVVVVGRKVVKSLKGKNTAEPSFLTSDARQAFTEAPILRQFMDAGYEADCTLSRIASF